MAGKDANTRTPYVPIHSLRSLKLEGYPIPCDDWPTVLQRRRRLSQKTPSKPEGYNQTLQSELRDAMLKNSPASEPEELGSPDWVPDVEYMAPTAEGVAFLCSDRSAL